MKKILAIDTTISRKATIKLIEGEKSTEISGDSPLPLIDKLLKKCHTNLSELTDLTVNIGPGSYTGLRVGSSIANTLSNILKIKINGKKESIFPKYTK